jgi:hypothetical protein
VKRENIYKRGKNKNLKTEWILNISVSWEGENLISEVGGRLLLEQYENPC